MTIAETILSQLGGKRFCFMCGAKNLVDCGKALMFTLPTRLAKHGINKVRVTLTDADDYTVEFYKTRGSKAVLVSGCEGVYHDQLVEVFENHTGLVVKL